MIIDIQKGNKMKKKILKIRKLRDEALKRSREFLDNKNIMGAGFKLDEYDALVKVLEILEGE